MGKSASKEALFIKEVKSTLRERGIRVKKKDLLKFFCYTEEKCPWLVLYGPDIHPLTWNKVGKCINELLRNGEEVPESFFSFYGIIRDILKDSEKEGKNSHLLALFEDFISTDQELRGAVRSELGPSPVVAPPGQGPKETKPVPPAISSKTEGLNSSVPSLLDEKIGDRNLHPPLTEMSPTPAIFPTPSLYPVIHKANGDDWLDPAEELDLEEEAAGYERLKYGPPFVAPIRTQEKGGSLQRLKWSQPPPYVPPEDLRPQPSAPSFPGNLPPQTPGIDDLLATKRSLTSQITQLRGVISLQKELKDLTTQIQTLQVDLLTPLSLPPSSLRPPNESSQTRPIRARSTKARSAPVKSRLTFPVMTRSSGTQAESSATDNEDGEDEDMPPLEGEEDEIQIEETQEGAEASNPTTSTSGSRIIKALKIKHLKELHSAVKNYGPAAPFTLSILEGLGQGGNLVPSEWTKVAQSVLSCGQYLTWRAELMEKLETQADVNKQNAATASWTLDKLTGRGKYATGTGAARWAT